MKGKAVLFDMDGVLIDSEVVMLRAAMDALREFGIETAPEDFTAFVGRRGTVFGRPGRTAWRCLPARIQGAPMRFMGNNVGSGASVPDGVLEVLRDLKGKGYRLAVGSSADLIKVQYKPDGDRCTGRDL